MNEAGSYAMNGEVNVVVSIVYLVLLIITIVGFWKIFTKAGKPGWAVIVPIYNIIVFLQIVAKPVWWIVLLFIPLVNIVIGIIMYLALLEKFGKPGWHLILIVLFWFVYFPYLGFSDAQYQAQTA